MSGLRREATAAIAVEVATNFGPGAAALRCAVSDRRPGAVEHGAQQHETVSQCGDRVVAVDIVHAARSDANRRRSKAGAQDKTSAGATQCVDGDAKR